MVDPLPSPSSPATISFRARTVSTPPRPKVSADIPVAASWTAVSDDHRDKSAADPSSRARHSVSSTNTSTTYFSIPKAFSISSSLSLFAKRRKSTARPHTSSQAKDALSDVIEIGPADRAASRDENNEEAERERLRDAAALALGLGLGREEQTEGDEDEDGEGVAQPTPVSDQTTQLQSIHEPMPHVPLAFEPSPALSSLNSLPQRLPSPSIATTSPSSDSVPPYPSALSALTPYIQARSTLLRYHPGGTFLAISLSRRTKQWRLRHVVLTSPSPTPFTLAHPDLLAGPAYRRPNGHATPQHGHLHLFKNASPTPDELEIDRLEINEDSVVFVAEHEVAGRRGVMKVGGRDARGDGFASAGASVKSVARTWHGGGTGSLEQNVEEMGRTMWLLKMSDEGDTQRWIGFIKSAVLAQRAERAGMTFHPNGSSNGVQSMRADLDAILSMRSQGFLPSVAAPRTESPAHSGPPPTINGSTSLAPNPRFAEHVGAAPSHSSPSSTVRARTYPPTSTSLKFQSIKGMFSGAPQNGPGVRSPSPHPQPEKHENIDPIAEESASLGTRATALLSIFRSSSRASYASHNRASLLPTPTQSPAPRMHDIGSPITPTVIVEPVQKPRSPADKFFRVDWSMMRDSGDNTNGSGPSIPGRQASVSLPPPPRNHRRPWTSGDVPHRRGEMLTNGTTETLEIKESNSQRSPTPPLSPYLTPSSHQASTLRPASLTSTSSYASVERDRLSDLSRWPPPRAVPKMLAPPTGPLPSAPSRRDQSPGGPPSPIFEQNQFRQSGSSRSEQHPGAVWGAQNNPHLNNPYSKRVSTSSARSVNTVSTTHSFLGAKSPPPPPRPPPVFAPPPIPPAEQPDTSPANTFSSSGRESFLPRPLRLSLIPPAAPPAHPPPPRPDEPSYRHRRSTSNEFKPPSNLFSISGSPTAPTFPGKHPPAAPPPNGPLPPIPVPESDKDATAARPPQPPSLKQRLRITSAPVVPSSGQTALPRSELARRSLDRPSPIAEPIRSYPEDDPHMFLSMNDTPTTPAMMHSASFLHVSSPLLTSASASFLHVSSPLQTSTDDDESTSLSPPPRRNSRASREIQRTPNPEREESKGLLNGDSLSEPRDSAVVIEQN